MAGNRDKRLQGFDRPAPFLIDFEGQPVTAYPNEPLAVALFASGIPVLSRSIKFHRPRGPFCLSGACGACLMRVGGEPSHQACQVLARPGLRCERQNAWPSAGLDLLGAADLFFPEAMDHHTMMTQPRLLNELMHKMVRQVGGLGRLPDTEVTPEFAQLPEAQSRHVALVVVGAGPAGLAAATAARLAGVEPVLLLEASPQAGGSYRSHPDHGPQAAAAAIDAAQRAGVELRCDSPVVGYYPEDQNPARPTAPPGLLCVLLGRRTLLKLSADRYLYCTGAYEQNRLFPDNDRPGVLAARAAGLLLCGYGVLPGAHPVVLGSSPYAARLTQALRAAGAAAQQVTHERVVALHGGEQVEALELEDARGHTRRLPCDLLAVAAPPTPASELPRQHGAQVRFDRTGGGDFLDAGPGGFAVLSDANTGATDVPGVYAAGDVTGALGVAAARAAGQRVGAALAAEVRHGR